MPWINMYPTMGYLTFEFVYLYKPVDCTNVEYNRLPHLLRPLHEYMKDMKQISAPEGNSS